ncbi:MAG: hypothetical protein JXR31_13105 [Prolixibacteraceae bacterium]|nr:hypothetical protein [Prolixibacteraceae bacterium]
MKGFFLKNKLIVVFVLIGAAGGFLYWKFIGCESGTCPIKSVWYWSTLWGAAIGYLVGDLIQGFIKKRRKGKNE